LAQQFALVDGGAFSQPLMPVGATGSLSITGIGNLGLADRLVLVATGDPDAPLGPDTISPVQTTSIDVRVGNGGFNNMGVPGAKFYHLASPGYGELSPAAIGGGTANPFFSRFSSSDTTSVFTDSTDQSPTFFVMWIGNNDILSYATGGGVGTDQTGNRDVSTYNSEDITDPGFFINGGDGAATGLPNYGTIAGALVAGGAQGVLVNIPDVSSIPYFTAVPYNPVELDQATADFVMGSIGEGKYTDYNAGVTAAIGFNGLTAEEAAARQIVFSEGFNPVVIFDEDLTDITGANAALVNMRQATADDFILLPASSKIGVDSGGLYGIGVPMADLDVLTEDEATLVEAARTAYNATIQAVANGSTALVLYDAAARMDELATDGIFYGTGGITATYATGGGFSLDGVHPTARGYAVIANDIIDTINTGFGANIPAVDPGAYTTVFIQ
jgi:lysophospholipase L1-like esterase